MLSFKTSENLHSMGWVWPFMCLSVCIIVISWTNVIIWQEVVLNCLLFAGSRSIKTRKIRNWSANSQYTRFHAGLNAELSHSKAQWQVSQYCFAIPISLISIFKEVTGSAQTGLGGAIANTVTVCSDNMYCIYCLGWAIFEIVKKIGNGTVLSVSAIIWCWSFLI